MFWCTDFGQSCNEKITCKFSAAMKLYNLIQLFKSKNNLFSITYALCPIVSDNACILLYYRGCWQRISRCLFSKYRHCFFSGKRSSRPMSLLPSRDISPSGFCYIVKNSSLLPLIRAWAVSQSQCS